GRHNARARSGPRLQALREPGIDVHAERRMRITAEVLEVPAAVPQGMVEAAVLPQVPDRRHMPPPVRAVRAEMPVQLAGKEGVPLFRGERVLPRGCRSVQQVLRHAPLRSRRDVAVTTASASPPCVLITWGIPKCALRTVSLHCDG